MMVLYDILDNTVVKSKLKKPSIVRQIKIFQDLISL